MYQYFGENRSQNNIYLIGFLETWETSSSPSLPTSQLELTLCVHVV